MVIDTVQTFIDSLGTIGLGVFNDVVNYIQGIFSDATGFITTLSSK